jgi:hypothetical protein
MRKPIPPMATAHATQSAVIAQNFSLDGMT